jgi:hypothetical protein
MATPFGFDAISPSEMLLASLLPVRERIPIGECHTAEPKVPMRVRSKVTRLAKYHAVVGGTQKGARCLLWYSGLVWNDMVGILPNVVEAVPAMSAKAPLTKARFIHRWLQELEWSCHGVPRLLGAKAGDPAKVQQQAWRSNAMS